MRSKKNGWVVRTLWWCALAVFVTSAVFLVVYVLQTFSQQRAMEEMSAYIKGETVPEATRASTMTVPAQPSPTAAAGETTAQPTSRANVHSVTQPTVTPCSAEDDALMRRFAALVEQNGDFVGWLSVNDTRIDDPVMYSQNDSQYYLYRDFDGAYSISGLPFLDASSDLEPVAGNKIVYGHNMKDGSRFGDLSLFLDEAFFRAHPYIQFDTLYGRGRYRVMAAFTIRVGKLDDPVMLCYRQIDTEDEAALAALSGYLDEYAEQRADDVSPLLGDELLTLSTCGRPGMRERVIVMARRVYE